jgi:hypothetical protein
MKWNQLSNYAIMEDGEVYKNFMNNVYNDNQVFLFFFYILNKSITIF